MFDLGWQEFMLIALIALIVVGPKDLPRVIRAVSQGIRRVRGVAREFHSSLEEVAREAELDDIRKQARDLANEGLDESLRKDLDPMGEIEHSIRDAQRQFNDANSAIGAAKRELKSDIAKAQEPAADAGGEPTAPEQSAPEPGPRTGPRADQRSCRGRWRGGGAEGGIVTDDQEGNKMPLLDHLVELRQRLLYSSSVSSSLSSSVMASPSIFFSSWSGHSPI